MLELISGGAASGKSEFAESEAKLTGNKLYYLATMKRNDPAGEPRISRHVERRKGMGFHTIECPIDIQNLTEDTCNATILLECLTNLAANELFTDDPAFYTKEAPFWCNRAEEVGIKVCNDIDLLYEKTSDMIIVTGDVFRDGIKQSSAGTFGYSPETEAYIYLLSILNRYVAAKADKVYEIIYSAKKRIK